MRQHQGDTYIEKRARRYSVTVYRHPDGTLRRRKVTHKRNRIVWDRIIPEDA